jgi:hypothetical protein
MLNLDDVLPLVVVVHLCAAGYCAIVARQKGRSGAAWGLLGLAISLIAILAVHARAPLPTDRRDDDDAMEPESTSAFAESPPPEAPEAVSPDAVPPNKAASEIDRLRAEAENLREEIAEQRELQRAREEVTELRTMLRDMRHETGLIPEAPSVPHEPTAAERELLRWGAEHRWPAIESRGLPHLQAGEERWRELVDQCHPDILERIVGDLRTRSGDSPVG